MLVLIERPPLFTTDGVGTCPSSACGRRTPFWSSQQPDSGCVTIQGLQPM